MAIDFSKFIDWQYWSFRFPPPVSPSFMKAWLAVGIAMVVAAIAGKVYLSRSGFPPAVKRILRSATGAVLSGGIVALILLFFRVERIPFFSMRLFLLLWAIILVGWLGFLVYQYIRKTPQEVRDWQERERIAKYLPKAK